jgi:GNAT superfamily N-acetyltransferase
VSVWARNDGVTLLRDDALDPAAHDGLRQALADGVERGLTEAPELPPDVERYAVRVGGETVGVLGLRRECPGPGLVALAAVAIDPLMRGASLGVRALVAAERRLARDGDGELVARVPRTNGRGLYFMLRAGYAPARDVGGAPIPDDGATWFRRAEAEAS